jgi:hypothetical protein
VDTRGRPLDDIARDGAVADPDPVRV